MYKVKQVAKLTGITVRTLHHYDEIGLLVPAEVRENGYRLYNDEDLERLQQILFFRELDVPLPDIRALLDDPGYDRKTTLLQHKKLLMEKKHRLEKIIRSVDQTIQSIEGGSGMSKKDMFEPFDMKEIEQHQKQYTAEAEERWGNTKAYKQSQQRTAAYTEADWREIKAFMDHTYRQLIELMPLGPEDDQTQAVIAAHHQHINDRFYACSPQMYRGLADLYVNDLRFTANIDKAKPGLAAFMREAMIVHCDRLEQEGSDL